MHCSFNYYMINGFDQREIYLIIGIRMEKPQSKSKLILFFFSTPKKMYFNVIQYDLRNCGKLLKSVFILCKNILFSTNIIYFCTFCDILNLSQQCILQFKQQTTECMRMHKFSISFIFTFNKTTNSCNNINSKLSINSTGGKNCDELITCFSSD